jgi:Ca2+-binding EF-hand superfamily protein
MTALVTAAQSTTDTTSPAESEDYAALFSSLDPSGTGVVTLRQFEESFDSLQLPTSVSELGPDAIFAMMDPTGTGSASQSAFVVALTTLTDADSYFGTAFAKVDSDGNGFISLTEFEQAFSSLSLPPAISNLGPQAVFSQLDRYYTGGVSIDDFVAGMVSLVATAGATDNASAGDGPVNADPVEPTPSASAVPDGLAILNGFYRSATITANSPTASPLLDPMYAQFVL